MATTYDKRTGLANKPGVTKDYSGIKDQSPLKYSETTGKPITSAALSPTTPMVLPNAVLPSDTNSVSELITSSTAANKAEQAKVDAAKKAKDTALSDLNAENLKLAGQSKRQDDIFVQEGGDEARKAYDEYTSQIEAEQLALRRTTEKLTKEFQGSKAGLNDVVAAKERASLSKQADLAILQNSALRKYDTASAIAARKVAAETDYIKAEIETKKLIYQDNKDAFTTAEQRLIDSNIRAEERAYNELVAEKTAINNTLLEAAKNNAPKSVIDKISGSKTAKEAISAAGSWMSDPLDRAIKNAQLANLKAPKAGDAPTIKTINGVDMEWDGAKWVTPKTDSVATTKEAVDKSLSQLTFLKDTANSALKKVDSSGGWLMGPAVGPSGITKFLGDVFIGSSDYRQMEQMTNTLATNMLTLMTDPTIKKFFGPQMSNNDVKLMVSAGTTLNPESQTPEQAKEELNRVLDLFNRMEQSVKAGTPEYQYIESISGAIASDGTTLSPNTYAQSLLQQP